MPHNTATPTAHMNWFCCRSCVLRLATIRLYSSLYGLYAKSFTGLCFFWFSNIWLLHNMIFQLPILSANKHHYVFRRCMNQYIIMFQSLNRPAYRFYLKLNIKQRLLIFILLGIGFWLSQISIVPILTLLLAPPVTALITPYRQHLWGNNIYWTGIICHA